MTIFWLCLTNLLPCSYSRSGQVLKTEYFSNCYSTFFTGNTPHATASNNSVRAIKTISKTLYISQNLDQTLVHICNLEVFKTQADSGNNLKMEPSQPHI